MRSNKIRKDGGMGGEVTPRLRLTLKQEGRGTTILTLVFESDLVRSTMGSVERKET